MAIFQHIFARIPVRESQVEHVFTAKRADAAGARAESVNQPGKFPEGGNLHDTQPLHGALRPIMRCERGTRCRFLRAFSLHDLLYGRRGHAATIVNALGNLLNRAAQCAFEVVH